MSDIQEQIKLAHKRAEENDIKLLQEEIKEILNKLLEYFKESNINDFGYEKDKLISYEEAQILLNYITNLQEENKKLKELCDKYEEEHNIKFNEWVFDKRENERLNLIIRAIKKQCEVWEDYEMSEFIKQLENEKEISTWLKRVAGVDKE